jgi:probable rRNA maturation factor
MMALDIEIDGWPSTSDWPDLAERALEAVLQIAPELDNQRLTADVLFTVDEEVQALNREWRMKDAPTNVLSFPMIARSDLLAMPRDGGPEMLGDIALAYETCCREAEEKRVPLDHHAAHLLVHGLLHLAGHDHQADSEAETMESLEIKALALMGIADPYANA